MYKYTCSYGICTIFLDTLQELVKHSQPGDVVAKLHVLRLLYIKAVELLCKDSSFKIYLARMR